jgi:hypothetical protein
MTGHTLRESVDTHRAGVPIVMPTNYVARLNQAGLAAFLRQPAPVQPYPAAASGALP